jgi:hypothetical protein
VSENRAPQTFAWMDNESASFGERPDSGNTYCTFSAVWSSKGSKEHEAAMIAAMLGDAVYINGRA